jgi:transmembrane sensor
MINEEKYLPLISKFLSGNASEAEKASLLHWVDAKKENKAFFEEATLLWEMSEPEESAAIDTVAPWAKLKAQLPAQTATTSKKTKVRKLGLWRWVAAASIIPIAFACYTMFFSSKQPMSVEWASVETKAGETKEIKLPDGSVVFLNENSRIQYPSDFERRAIKLSGEAFFEVTKQNGKTFQIEAGESRTTVLGTSFNVRAYPSEKDVEVTVVTGKVALANTQDSILLLPGEKGETNYEKPSKVLKTHSAQQNETSWKTQALDFEDSDISTIFLALERHFHIKIECKDSSLLDYHFTGHYKNPKLAEILKVMQFSLDLTFEKKDSTYYVSKNK